MAGSDSYPQARPVASHEQVLQPVASELQFEPSEHGLSLAAGQVSVPHWSLVAHVTSHAHAWAHEIEPHAFVPLQLTVQAPSLPPQSMFPHASVPLQLTVHATPAHDTVPQAFVPLHWMLHWKPCGHENPAPLVPM
jgi:hypothetical protein